MIQPLLSILIPTVVGREDEFNRLHSTILSQIYVVTQCRDFIQSFIVNDLGLHGGKFDNLIELIWCIDDKSITIGEKRERLYKYSSGLYSWQIDDDDDIADNAIELILDAIKNNPGVDVISFEEYCNMDGEEYKSNHSNEYHDWEGDGNSIFPDGFHFHRTIFFKDVIRTELAKSVPVPKLRWAEDHEYSKLLKPLIKSEKHISEQLYRYIHISSNPEERYGLNK
jgi:hypothetical protein